MDKAIYSSFFKNKNVRLAPVGIKASSQNAERTFFDILRKNGLLDNKENFSNIFNKENRLFSLPDQNLEDFFGKYTFKREAQLKFALQVWERGKKSDDMLVLNNEFVVKLKRKVSTKQFEKMLDNKKLTIVNADKWANDFFIVRFNYGTYEELFETIERVSNNKGWSKLIEFIHPNFESVTQRNDVENSCTINLMYYQPKWLDIIKAPKAWDYINTHNLYKKTIPLVLVDQGIDVNHVEFRPDQFYDGINAFSKNSSILPDDQNENHGTACSGILLSQNKYQGILGIAPDLAKVYGIKIFEMQGATEYSAKNGLIRTALITYANFPNNLPMVYNFSCKLAGYDDSIQDAFTYLNSSKKLLVCAAGNKSLTGNTDIVFPAQLAHSICVGSVNIDVDTGKIGWSDFNCHTGDIRSIDVCAPGNLIETTSTNQHYCTFSGTSFATPLVSGLAAMIFSINPDLTSTKVKEIILDTANPHFDGYEARMGRGVIDCEAAIRSAHETLIV